MQSFPSTTRNWRRSLPALMSIGVTCVALAGCAQSATTALTEFNARPTAQSAQSAALTPNQLLERSRSLLGGSGMRNAGAEASKDDASPVALVMAVEQTRLTSMRQTADAPDASIMKAGLTRREVTTSGRPGTAGEDPEGTEDRLQRDAMLARLEALARNARATGQAVSKPSDRTASQSTFVQRADATFGALTHSPTAPAGARLYAPLR